MVRSMDGPYLALMLKVTEDPGVMLAAEELQTL
jgi:hypothetical protein